MSESTVVERLGLLQPDWSEVERRSQHLRRQQLRRQTLLTLGLLAAAAVLAGGAYAAVRAWVGHNLTPADIARQATTVYNDKWQVCSGHNQCTTQTGTHTEVDILPSMGVVFILPDGRHEVDLVPAAGIIVDRPRHLGTLKPIKGASGDWTGRIWRVPLPDGATRTISWNARTGAVTMTDIGTGGATTTSLQAGDVVPLIPGSLTNDQRTLDKAVTFDLPTGNRVIIFPQLNETYLDFPEPQPGAEPLPYNSATKYGLTPIGHYNGKLPVTASGGTWTVHLNGLTSTVTWHAGDSFVTVEDTNASGSTTTKVPIGHELPLVPFK